MSSYFNKGDFSAQHVASSYQKEKDEMPRKSRILEVSRRTLHDDPTSALDMCLEISWSGFKNKQKS